MFVVGCLIPSSRTGSGVEAERLVKSQWNDPARKPRSSARVNSRPPLLESTPLNPGGICAVRSVLLYVHRDRGDY